MYIRLKELLEQVLLEFDPKQIKKREKGAFFRGTKHSRADSARVRAETGEIDRADVAFDKNKRKLPFINKKKIKKAGRRALARGGEGDIERTIK